MTEAQQAQATTGSFEVGVLTALLDRPYAELHDRIRSMLSEPGFAYRHGLDRTEYRELVLGWCRDLARRGLGATAVPSADGGPADPGRLVATFEGLAFHDLSLVVKFGVQFGLFGGAVHRLGTEEHHRLLPAIAAMDLTGCFAMTETDHGSNVREVETVARYDAATEEFVVHTPHDGARKDYIGNALHGRMAVVFAQLETAGARRGVHALLVPLRGEDGDLLPGVEVEDCGEKLGLNGVDNGRIRFHRVRVPRTALLDRFGQVAPDGAYSSPIEDPSSRFFTMLGTLVPGRMGVAVAAVSASKSALTIAVRYGARRRQFGPPGGPERPILDYLSHQRRLMPRLAATYALDFALEDLVTSYLADADGARHRELEALAGGLKALATRHATDTIQTCREACGGQGYLSVNRLAALKADTDAFTTFEGDNVVLLQLVTRSLLAEYRQEFEDLDLLGLARYLASRAAEAVAEGPLLGLRRTDEDHLLDRRFHLEAYRFRAEHTLAALARRLQRRVQEGMDVQEAFLECQDHVLAAARYHLEHAVLERFAGAADRCERPDLARVLGSMVDLHALAGIEADRGWFQEHGHLGGAAAKTVRKLVNRLCGELRREAVPLVDAFGIPDAILGAPIATKGE